METTLNTTATSPATTAIVPEQKVRRFKDLKDYFLNGLFPEISEKKVLPPYQLDNLGNYLLNSKGERILTPPIAFKNSTHLGQLHFFSPISDGEKAYSFWSTKNANPRIANLATEFSKVIEFMVQNNVTVDLPTTYIDDTGKIVTEVLNYSGYYSFNTHAPILFRTRQQEFDLNAFDQMLAQYKPNLEPESILTGKFNVN
jgi:hypothetical protein